ncbi:SCO family protein [Altererythrobacter sp. Root672]|uniref:SCO family protein n=1 Tax=Altererythrobacter sp. Root672 TaxID=1736584 RepID=UPI0006F3CA6B|nr:SCO family protein [Altererythrobacter sp. Root672]KRA81375.1 electron transporter [Altererythrobacter sp. Root672]
MNIDAMTCRSTIAATCLLLSLILSGCGNSTASPAADAPLAGAQIGGPFELVDTQGKTVRWSDFDGKFRMVYFGYAYCPDICPFDVQRMMKGFEQFKKAEPELAAQVQPLFITIDPSRDTPKVVGEFTSAFSDDLIGLTGTQEQIAQAAKAFAVYYTKGEVSESGGYLMDHSRAAFLMGRKGEPIALLPVEKGPNEVAAELERWVS